MYMKDFCYSMKPSHKSEHIPYNLALHKQFSANEIKRQRSSSLTSLHMNFIYDAKFY